jgi:serine/threonine-protein phosphatase 2B regulatory subunit
MECFDENGDGSVDFEEFVNGLAVFSSRGRKQDKIRCKNLNCSHNLLTHTLYLSLSHSFFPLVAFDIYDIDKDGYISNGELFLTLKIMCGDHLEDIHLQQVVDKTIRDADEDGDGRISFEEFKKLVETRNSHVLDKWTLTDL